MLTLSLFLVIFCCFRDRELRGLSGVVMAQQPILSRNVAFLSAPVDIGDMQPIRWTQNGTHIDGENDDPNNNKVGIARMRLSPALTAILTKYAELAGIQELFRNRLWIEPTSSTETSEEETMQLKDGLSWQWQRPSKSPTNIHTDMHWLRATNHNDASMDRILSVLAHDGHLEQVLNVMGQFFQLDSMDVVDVGFVGITYSEEAFVDNLPVNLENNNKKIYQIMIPLQLKEGSRPEFWLETSNGGIVKLHYEPDVALVVDATTTTKYGTAACDYRDSPYDMRFGLTITVVADIQSDNMAVPSSGGKHWKKDGSVHLTEQHSLTIEQQRNLGIASNNGNDQKENDNDDDETCEEDEWMSFNRNDFYEYLECKEYFGRPREVPEDDVWMLVRQVYEKAVGVENSSISPISEKDGFVVGAKPALSPGRGRGMFATHFIPKGTLLYVNRQKGRFPTAMSYRRFLMGLPRGMACDYLIYVYLQTVGGDKTNSTVTTLLSAELDVGVLVNGGAFPSEEAEEEGDDIANSGCTLDPNDIWRTGCDGVRYYAWDDIKEGEEFFCYYGGWGDDVDSNIWSLYNMECDVCG